jgi:ferredoxin-NADP reductase
MLSLREAALPDRHWIDFVLQHVDPTLSLTRTLARIIHVHAETPDMKTIVLRPAHRRVRFAAGQSIPVRITVGGVVHERPYSPTSRPGDATLTITVKHHPGGVVSTWLHERATVGDVVELGPPQGDFVLPRAMPCRLLLVAGGSGITATYALLRAALRAHPETDVTLLYYAPRPDSFAFVRELAELEREHPRLRAHLLVTRPGDGGQPAGRLSSARLDALVPDHARRETYVCGPPALVAAASEHWTRAGLAHRLHRESFAPPLDDDRAAGRDAVPVQFRRSARSVAGVGPTLLAIAESAGLRPPTGCRMGICRTCTCTKISGAVRDRVTGAVDDAPMSRIRLCVSEPLGPVTLDL